METKMEFAVRMTCQSCADAVDKALNNVEGIKSYSIDLGSECVIVETTLNSNLVQAAIEQSGRQAVLQGLGSASVRGQNAGNLGAAVAMMSGREKGEGVQGVVRMVQLDEQQCVMEGTIDGLTPGRHALRIHELGDLSKGCYSCGNIFGTSRQKAELGDLGTVHAGPDGRAMFRKEMEEIKVWDIIGRSMVVYQDTSDISIKDRLACGIIARSSGILENAKRICACDGVTIWDERHVPAAGSSRQQQQSQHSGAVHSAL